MSASMRDRLMALAQETRKAMAIMQRASGSLRVTAIRNMASGLRDGAARILAANQLDMRRAKQHGLSVAMLDRLALDTTRVDAIAEGLDTIAALPDPVGRILARTERPNGLMIERVSVPLGVIGIIYESRPNVTADAAAICIRAANGVILRGGSESARTSRAIVEIVRAGLDRAGLPAGAVSMVPDQDRRWVGEMLAGAGGEIDVVVPRGGRGLVERVQRDARVPVIGHLEGLCHVYVHTDARLQMACEIVVNAKLRRTGICGAAETLLIDANWPTEHSQALLAALRNAGCALRGCERTCALDANASLAQQEDWTTEYLAPILSVRIVDGLDAALAHITTYGSGHTDCIITDDEQAAARFIQDQDSAIVMHNASTQFADGGEFGMGAEIGISTGRIHARGPVGAAELTSYKHVVRGGGQIRS
ncbi:MAG: glutamate-5-semialdehyde dehydrogenase [Pseudomonadota bacterium]